MIVLDASAAIEWLLQTPKAAAVERHLFPRAGRSAWHAPHLIDLEVGQVVRRHVAAGVLSTTRGREAVHDLMDLPLTRYPHDVLLPRIWELRQNLTAYDAAYVALAEALEMPLITGDRHLAAARGHRARVTLIE